MKIAVLSGKGGTGKTLVAVNLSAAAPEALYVDCDVEEPNGHLFFKPEVEETVPVSVSLPQFDKSKCVGCRICVNFCAFNALAFIGGKPLLFPDVCHSCGGCAKLCPQKAITEVLHSVGQVAIGNSGNVTVFSGQMETGNASGTPIIRELYCQMEKSCKTFVVLDCPPGSACMVMESIKDADYCVLVAEPTIFGAHNLAMVFELVKKFNKPCGVVLNKCLESENPSEAFCMKHDIIILDRIPFDPALGELNSNGGIAVRELPTYHEKFSGLLERIRKESGKCSSC